MRDNGSAMGMPGVPYMLVPNINIPNASYKTDAVVMAVPNKMKKLTVCIC